jgi:hypothetical protein
MEDRALVPAWRVSDDVKRPFFLCDRMPTS